MLSSPESSIIRLSKRCLASSMGDQTHRFCPRADSHASFGSLGSTIYYLKMIRALVVYPPVPLGLLNASWRAVLAFALLLNLTMHPAFSLATAGSVDFTPEITTNDLHSIVAYLASEKLE